jgi:hypothetical protein
MWQFTAKHTLINLQIISGQRPWFIIQHRKWFQGRSELDAGNKKLELIQNPGSQVQTFVSR